MSSATISKKDAGGDKNVIDDLPQTCSRKAARLQENGEDDNKTIKELKMEVEALKSRCNGYEREIRDLQGMCDTHENVLEMLRQQIMRLVDAQGIPNTTYGGKSYVLIP
ncbi:hypothetical protein EI94DRAFT_1708091 [Lactarius quietus]|nr:hypothetical protein EI94DRAFT_1708091 [Lactarius quietus]